MNLDRAAGKWSSPCNSGEGGGRFCSCKPTFFRCIYSSASGWCKWRLQGNGTEHLKMTPSVCFLVCVNVLWFSTTQCSILEIIFLMGLIYRSVLANMGKIKWLTKCFLSAALVYGWMSSLVFQGSCYACHSCTIYIHSLMLKGFRIEHCPWIWDLKLWCTNHTWCLACECELRSRSCKLSSTFPTLWSR